MDASTTTVEEDLQIQVRKQVSTGTAAKRFPCLKRKKSIDVAAAEEEDLLCAASHVARRDGNAELDARSAVIENASGAAFDRVHDSHSSWRLGRGEGEGRRRSTERCTEREEDDEEH